MNLALGMLCHNDAFLLSKILPILRPHFDTFIAGYSDSTDNTNELLKTHDAVVEIIQWTHDWGSARNQVITQAEELGCTHMMMIDSDECMLPSDLDIIRRMEFPDATLFPRHEFVDDFDHVDPSLYPDFQARMFPLNKGFHYEGKMHEQLCRDGKVCSQSGSFLRFMAPIFHYGKCKPAREVQLKYLNYDRMYKGQEPLPDLPEDYALPDTWSQGPKTKFEGPKPL